MWDLIQRPLSIDFAALTTARIASCCRTYSASVTEPNAQSILDRRSASSTQSYLRVIVAKTVPR